jgi:hypothetical protein
MPSATALAHFALTSSGLNVTTAGAVSGVTTLSTSGIITVGAVGAASNDTVVFVAMARTNLPACNSTFLTTGDLNVSNVFHPRRQQLRS